MPPINSEDQYTISALMMSKNTPRLMMVIGMVKNTKIGLISALKIDSTKAKMIAVIKLSIYTPDKTQVAKP